MQVTFKKIARNCDLGQGRTKSKATKAFTLGLPTKHTSQFSLDFINKKATYTDYEGFIY